MTTLLATYLFGLAAAVVLMMLRQHMRGTHELLSLRNFALVGFVLFQLTSGATGLFEVTWGGFHLSNGIWTGLEFSAMVSVFLLIALWSYERGWIVVPMAHRAPTTRARPSQFALLVMCVIMTILGAALRFGVRIPYIGVITGYVGVGFAAIAVGLVGWVWARRVANVGLLLFGAVILAANFILVLTGTFGRRGIVAVGAALVWGVYYSAWRHLPRGVLLRRLAIAAIVPVIVLAAFTSVRNISREQQSTMDQIRKVVMLSDLRAGLMELLHGQRTGRVSMWLIENYPEEYPYRHMHTLTYFFFFPVPRALWTGKPDALSQGLATKARLQGVNRAILTIGPGIIGHAAAEGGWYAVVIYAVVAGLFLRFFDEILFINSKSPLIVLAIGSALGQAIGLARGAVAPFAFTLVTTIVGTLACMLFLGWALERMTPAEYEDTEQYDGDDGDQAYAEWNADVDDDVAAAAD
jgi:hypothetical protein